MIMYATLILKTKVTSVKQVQRFHDLVENSLKNHSLRHPVDVIFERTCVHCGCTDSKGCRGGCSWMIRHKKTPTGVCSQCLEKEMKLVDSL